MKKLVILFAFIAWSAQAQQGAFEPPDQELWQQMSQAFGNISMPLTAHQQVQQIMQNVEREAAARAARKKATEQAPPK